jgi:hypothetical protein
MAKLADTLYSLATIATPGSQNRYNRQDFRSGRNQVDLSPIAIQVSPSGIPSIVSIA